MEDSPRRLQTAMQYSSESKLLRFPAQPPYTKRTHFLRVMSKCQRGMEARQGPVSGSRPHTAAGESGGRAERERGGERRC